MVSNIAEAISSTAGRREVKIQSTDENLVSGQSVRALFVTEINEDAPVFDPNRPQNVPLTSVKFQTDEAFVFTVNEEMELVAAKVEIGNPQGASIEIISGLPTVGEIVLDVRGLSAGQAVTVK